MRTRILFAVALVTGGSLAACSRPAGNAGRTTDPRPAARDIRLVAPPAVDDQPVSDLEAGRIVERRLVRRVERVVEPEPVPASGSATLAPAPAEVAPGAPADPAPEPPVEAAESAPEAEAPPEIIRAPMPAAWTGGVGTGQLMGGIGNETGAPGRGPVIIIRGGRGGIDDDCDLHRRGGRIPITGGPRGPGIAINQSGPSIPGGSVVGDRTPGLTSGLTGRSSFPRGGIR